MSTFVATAIGDKDGKSRRVQVAWHENPRGWSGGVASADGRLENGTYTIKLDSGERVQIRVTAQGARGEKFQPFQGVGSPPSSDGKPSAPS